MDDLFTQPPWLADVGGRIYAVNGRPGQTTVATLLGDASAELLAASPDLLNALENSMECLEQEYAKPASGGRMLVVLSARNQAETAIAHAKRGSPVSAMRERRWTINPDLPEPESKANAHLFDAALELHEAVKKAYAALAGHVDNPEVVGALHKVMTRLTL